VHPHIAEHRVGECAFGNFTEPPDPNGNVQLHGFGEPLPLVRVSDLTQCPTHPERGWILRFGGTLSSITIELCPDTCAVVAPAIDEGEITVIGYDLYNHGCR
jgi:hypothetical protein